MKYLFIVISILFISCGDFLPVQTEEENRFSYQPGFKTAGRIRLCDDGTDLRCEKPPPQCTEFELLSVRNECWECVNPTTCGPWGTSGCQDDSECPSLMWCDPCGTSSCPDCDDCIAACTGHGCDSEETVTCPDPRLRCPKGYVSVVRNGCWACVDLVTCE